MAGDQRQSQDALLEQLTTRMRESLLPVDLPFDSGELEHAAAFVLQTAARRPTGEPQIAMADGAGNLSLIHI